MAPGELIFAEGDSGDAAFFIRSGSVDILIQGPQREPRLLNRLGRGQLFGEMALLDRTRRSASAVAHVATELMVVPRAQVTELLEREPRLTLWMLGLSARRLRVVTRMVAQTVDAQEANLKFIAGQEQERRRIGRDMHDGVAQTLVGLLLRTQSLSHLLDQDVEAVRAALGDLESGLRDSLVQIRDVTRNLFPKTLREAGLIGAIDQLLDRTASADGLRAVFEHRGADEELPAALEAALFCILQEAVNNVRRHARASEVRVVLESDAQALTLAVSDDGCGLDLGSLAANQSARECYGLQSMEERARLAGGTMEIDAQPGMGTTLRFAIPLR